MPAYIALLRAVNVSGTDKLAMRNLKLLCEQAGFQQPHRTVAIFLDAAPPPDVQQTAVGRKDESIEAHRTALRKNNRSIVGYRRLAIVLRDAGRDKEASEVLLTGVAVVPNSAMLQSDYGEDLQRQGRNHDAMVPLRKAYEMQPDNIRFQVGLAEAEFNQGQAADGIKLATIVKDRMGNGEKLPGNIKQRAEKLISRVPASDLEPVTPANPGR